MPKKDRLPSPGEAGTKLLNSSLVVDAEILNQRARPTVSTTSVKTAPNPSPLLAKTFWGITDPLLPGIKNKASVMLLPTGVNNRNGLKVLKMVP